MLTFNNENYSKIKRADMKIGGGGGSWCGVQFYTQEIKQVYRL